MMKHSDNFEAACYLLICSWGSFLIYHDIKNDYPLFLFVLKVVIWGWVFSKLWTMRNRHEQS